MEETPPKPVPSVFHQTNLKAHLCFFRAAFDTLMGQSSPCHAVVISSAGSKLHCVGRSLKGNSWHAALSSPCLVLKRLSSQPLGSPKLIDVAMDQNWSSGR